MPMVFSAEGRQHPATTRMLHNTLKAIARKVDDAELQAIRRRWAHDIGVAIQSRKVSMIRACLPEQSHHHAWLLHGHLANTKASDRPGNPAAKLPSLEMAAEHEPWLFDLDEIGG